MNSDSVNIAENSDGPETGLKPVSKARRITGVAVPILRWFYDRILRGMAELTAVVLGGGIIWLGILTSIMAKGEADVSFLKQNFSLWFAQAYDGQDADIETFKVQWHPDRVSIGLLAKGISVKDDKGQALLTVESIYTESGIGALLNKGFEPKRLDLAGGQFTIKRDENGALLGAVGEPDSFGRLGPIIPISAGSNGPQNQDSIDAVSLAGTDVFYRDELLGLDVDLTSVNFDTNISNDEIVAMGDAKLVLDEALSNAVDIVELPEISIKLTRARTGDKSLDVDLEIIRFNPASLKLKDGGFNRLKQVDMPLDLMLNWREVKDQTRRAKFDVTKHDTGSVGTFFAFDDVDELSVSGTMDVLSDQLSFGDIEVSTGGVQFKGSGNVEGLLAQRRKERSRLDYTAEIDQLRWHSPDILTRPLEVNKGEIKGTYDFETARLSLLKTRLPIETYVVKAQGELSNIIGKTSEGEAFIKLKGGVDGTLSEYDLLALWPKNYILGGRNWVKSSIVSANLYDLNFDVDISDFSKLEGGLPNDAVRLDFRVSDGLVDYIRTMTPLDNATGYGRLRANGIEMTLTSGNVGEMIIDKGRVEIPQFFPYGNDFTIEFEGRGPVNKMVELIDQKPFEYASLYNLSPQDFSGQAYAKMKVTRPLREYFDQSRISYEVDVRGENVSAPFGFGDYKLTNGGLFLTADKTGMTIKGPAQIGPLTADINWRETFDFGATPTSLTLVSRIDSTALDKFGVSLREYFGGDIPFTLNAKGQGIAFDKANITADLRESEWVFGDIWTKSKGTEGRADMSIMRLADGQVVVDDFNAVAPGLNINGALRLAKDMRLMEASLGKVSIENFVDARVTLARDTAASPLQATLSGDYLNLDGFIRPALWQSGGGVQLPVTLSANLNALRLAPDYEISKATLIYNNSGTSIDRFRFTGGSQDGPVTLDLRTLDDGPFSSRLTFDVANASDVVTAFFNLDNITGGRLYGEAVHPRKTADLNGDDLIWSGTVNVDDFTLVDAPFLAQMLTLASLNGLGDILGGEGINFETVEVPFTWGDGVLGLESARAAGPALGLTGDGQINIESKTIDIDGTLIPAYAANSVLGSIPILGDILGGNSDDATLGLTYGVNGRFDEAQVSVNPLSALTPGLLRKIFKPSREKKRIEIPSDNP